jgi:hypothetical protein
MRYLVDSRKFMDSACDGILPHFVHKKIPKKRGAAAESGPVRDMKL